jgi:hypothetical protein
MIKRIKKLFKSKYLDRIEEKIIDLELQKYFLKKEEESVSILKPAERVSFIVKRQEADSQIKLLKSLL